MNILVTICARGGSKGIPGKNIKDIGGKPLIAYTIDKARMLCQALADDGHHARVALSTDSELIIATAARFGLTSEYRRPDFLANDTAGKVDAIADLVRFCQEADNVTFDYVIDLDVTSPLRTVDDILRGLDMLSGDADALNLFSVSQPGRNPYFNIVEQATDGYYRVVKPLPDTVFSRQAAPKVYDINGSFYIYRHEFFATGQRSALTARTMVFIMNHICFDLDNPIDYDFMNFLITDGRVTDILNN